MRGLLLGVLLWVGAIGVARADEVVVFAAASLTEALQEIGGAYERETGTRVVLNLGASNLLARQIGEGASADLFLSADEAKMDELEKIGLLLPDTRRSVLSNTLVVVVPRGSRLRFAGAEDLAGPGLRTLVIAEPTAVPAGIYAKQYLRAQGVWSKVIDRIVPTENVRAALAAVDAGNADAGIVYRTDAGIGKDIVVAFEVPVSEGPRISYPFAALRASRDPAGAKKLLAYLTSPAALDVFRRFGFSTRP